MEDGGNVVCDCCSDLSGYNVLCSSMILWIAFATPHRIIHADCIIAGAPPTSFPGVAAHETFLLNVLLAYCSPTELANCSRFIFTFDAFHSGCDVA